MDGLVAVVHNIFIANFVNIFSFCEVESYDPANNQWTVRPSLKVKKGSLAGATLNNQIFAIGGRDGVESFADVEMFDIDGGHWISKPSMVQKVIPINLGVHKYQFT